MWILHFANPAQDSCSPNHVSCVSSTLKNTQLLLCQILFIYSSFHFNLKIALSYLCCNFFYLWIYMHVFGSLSCFICFKFSVLQFNSCIFFSILPNLLLNPSIKLLIPIIVTPFLESNLVLSFDSIYLFNGLATFSYSVAFLISVILILSTCVRICSLCLVLPALSPSHSPVASLRAVLSLCDLSSREEALLLGQSGMPFLCSC